MRRLLVALAVSAGVLVCPSSASAQLDLLEFQSAVDAMLAVDPTLDPPPNDGKKDFVVGGVQDSLGFRHGISAHSGPAGEDAFGHVSTQSPTGQKQRWDDVVCLAVLGNLAAIGVRGRFWSPGGEKFPEDTIFVAQDNGPGGALDRWSYAVAPSAPETCASHLSFAATAPFIRNGNILIHDAMP